MTAKLLPPAICAALNRSGVLTRSDLLSLGADDAALRRWVRGALLVRVRGGVYAAPSPDDQTRFLTELRAAVAAGPDVVVSHRAAAHLHGLPNWRSRPRPEVTRVERGARIRGVLVHRYGVDADQVGLVSGLPVTNVVRTLIDVCRVLPIPEALVPFDAALRSLKPDLELLPPLLEKLGDINHRKRALQTSRWADGASENPFESYSRGKLLCEGIPAPRLQWWVGDGADTWFRPDKLWPDRGIVGEADGRGKYREVRPGWPNALVAEKARQEWFEDRDFVFVRWGPHRISHRADEVAARWRALQRRQHSRLWTWPEGVWLVCPGPWPPSRAAVRDESSRFRRL